MKITRFAILAVCLLGAAVALAACGGSGESTQSKTIDSSGQPISPTGSSGASDAARNGDKSGKGGNSKGGSSSASNPNRQAPSPTAGFKREPPPIQLYTSATSGVKVGRATLVSIRNRTQLRRWLRKTARGSGGDTPVVNVNFDEGRQAWAVFAPRTKPGSRLTIANAFTKGNRVIIYATMLVPGDNCPNYGGDAEVNPTAWSETRRLGTSAELKLNELHTTC